MKIENISDLQVLVHTARAGTHAAAAHALGITPAADKPAPAAPIGEAKPRLSA